MALDKRKWFDRSQPQTLQIATWLLYLNAFFRLVDLFDARAPLSSILKPGRDGLLFFFLGIVLAVAGGWLMANDRKLGYYLAVAAAFWPFVLRFYFSEYRIGAIYNGTTLLNLIFEVALCALILHPQSRNHQRIWFK